MAYVINIDGVFDALRQNNIDGAKPYVVKAEKEVEHLEKMIKQFAPLGQTAVPILRQIIDSVKGGEMLAAQAHYKNEAMRKGYQDHLQGYLKDGRYKADKERSVLQHPDSDHGPNYNDKNNNNNYNKSRQFQGTVHEKNLNQVSSPHSQAQDSQKSRSAPQGDQSLYQGNQHGNQGNQSSIRGQNQSVHGDKYKTKEKHSASQGNHCTDHGSQVGNEKNQSTYPKFNKLDVDSSEADSVERKKQVSKAINLNNPDIADLSDMNRPTKLAEKFSELYDNEWTEVFDYLNTRKNVPERKIIQELLLIVQEAYKICKQEADEQIKTMVSQCFGIIGGKESTTYTNYTETDLSLMREFRKTNAHRAIPRLQSNFFETKIKRFNETNLERIPPPDRQGILAKYADKAIEITWFMNVQVPPVYMCQASINEFDNNLYRAYTKSGKVPDFFVWPALRLYEKGGVLVKGVVQFK